MHLIPNAVKTAISEISRFFSSSSETHRNADNQTMTLYHVVHHNKYNVMTEDDFSEFRKRVTAGEVNKKDYYVDRVETVPASLYRHHNAS